MPVPQITMGEISLARSKKHQQIALLQKEEKDEQAAHVARIEQMKASLNSNARDQEFEAAKAELLVRAASLRAQLATLEAEASDEET
jgi:uncharacterized protein YacL (UPF0231 family)